MAPSSPWPSRRSLILITLLVVLVHIGLLLGGPDALQLSLRAEPVKTLPFQTATPRLTTSQQASLPLARSTLGSYSQSLAPV